MERNYVTVTLYTMRGTSYGPSVCPLYKLVLYRNDWTGFWHGCFLSHIVHCVNGKFGDL